MNKLSMKAVRNLNNKLRNFRAGTLALLFLAVAVAPYGCKTSEFDGMKEGKVVYDVAYEGDDMPPMMKALLPSEVTTYFGNNQTAMVISMNMNMAETKLISDAVNLKQVTLVSAMGRKIAMVMDKAKVEENYLDRVDLKIVHTNEEKEIAGIVCKQVLVTDSTDHTYAVYYTEDLDIDKPNWSTPFREIKGLLMEYSVKINGIKMNLKAKEIVNVKHDPAFFSIPEGYEIISDPKELRMGF